MSDRETPEGYIHVRSKDGKEQLFKKRGDASRTLGETLEDAPQTAASAGLATALWSREFAGGGITLAALLDDYAKSPDSYPTEEESLARFARYQETLREYEEWLATLRKQAPQHIHARHIKHARSRLDWATVADAQYPTPTLRRNADHPRGDGRLVEIVKQRDRLAGELKRRIEEPEIQERAAAELLAYTWADYAARYDDTDAPIDDILRDYLPTPEDWQIVSETRLDIEALERILDITPKLPATAPAFQDGWATTPSVALLRGALRHLQAPWSGDRSAWPEARFDWTGKAPGFVLFTLHENPAGASETERRAAWESVDKLNDWTAVTLATIAAIYRRNRHHDGRLEVETNDILRVLKRGTPKGFKAADKDAVNEALYILSRIVVYRLKYEYVPPGKRSREPYSNKDHEGIYPILWLAERKRNGRNITWDIQLGPDLLQMAEHFPRQYAHIVAGGLSLDGRRPHPGRLDLLLPLEARARPAVFTQHGITVRELLELANVNADAITRQDRPWWKKNLPGILDDCATVAHWTFKAPPGARWADWLEARIVFEMRQRTDPSDDEEDPLEEPPQSSTIAPGWLS